MDKLKLTPIIHSKEVMEALNYLLDFRISELKDRLVTADISDVRGIQVTINELKKLKGIREEMLK